MKKLISVLLVAAFVALPVAAQQRPSPTFNNLTVEGTVTFPANALEITRIANLQAALDGKAATVHAHAAGDVTSGTFADARIPSLAISKITGLQAAIDTKAPLASPALTGTPTAPTAANGTNTTQIATTAFVLANASSATPPNMVTTDTTQTVSGLKTFSGATTTVSNDLSVGDDATVTDELLVSGSANIGRPADFWSTNANQIIKVMPNGWVGHNGSNAVTIASNYYRNTSALSPVWNSGVGTGASGIELYPNGNIQFRCSSNWDGSAVSPPVCYTMPGTAPTRGDRSASVANTAFVQANKGSVDPIDYGATCGGAVSATVALSNAATAAASAGVPVMVTCELLVGNLTINSDIQFTSSGSLNVVSGGVVTITGEIIAADGFEIAKGLGRFALGGVKNQRLSVCWYGACDGSADVADDLRSFFGSGVSNKDVVFPPANYNLCTSVASGYPAFNNYSIGIVGLQRIKVDATNATFTTCAAIAQSTQVQISTSSDITWDGGSFVGTRSGLATSTVNNPFGLMNTTRLRLRNARALSGFGDNGAMFEGDFNRDFVIEDNIGYVGQGVDMAFSLNGVYQNNQFRGTVGTSTYGVGPKCMSHIYDGPMVGQGTTGFTVSENVKFIGNRCDNYITGVLIQEGRHIQIHDNFFTNIVGATGQPASGVLINYVPSGDFANVGHTPWNVSIRGNHFDGLGTAVAGCAVNFGANAIANSDVFNRFIIDGNMMSGSASSSGICSDTTSGAKLANVFIGINEFSNLAGLMNANMAALDIPNTLPRQ